MTQTRSLMESALLTGLSVVMFIGSNLPVAGILLALLSPVPLVVLGLRHPMRNSLMGLVVAALIVMLILGPVSALSFVLGFGLLGVLLGRLVQKKKDAVEIMLYGSMISLTCKLLLMALLVKITGLNPLDLDVTEMQSLLDTLLKLPSDPQTAAAMKEQWTNTLQLMPMIIPAILVMASVVDCWMSYWISGRVIKRLRGAELPKLPPFTSWRFPQSVLFAFFAAVICSYIGLQYGGTKGLLLKVGLNLRLLVSSLFIIQGLSVAAYFLKRKNVNNFVIGLMIAAVILIPMLSQLVTIVGIFDICWDLRVRYGGDHS